MDYHQPFHFFMAIPEGIILKLPPMETSIYRHLQAVVQIVLQGLQGLLWKVRGGHGALLPSGTS